MPTHSPRSSGLDAITRAKGFQYNFRAQSPIPTTPEHHTNHQHPRPNAVKSSRLCGGGISPCFTSTLTFFVHLAHLRSFEKYRNVTFRKFSMFECAFGLVT